MKHRMRLFWLMLASFLACLGPLLTVALLRASVYLREPADVLRLSLGGVLLSVLLLCRVLGKLKMPRRIVVYALALLLVWLLEPILADLKLFILAGLCGETVDYILLEPLIARERARRERELSAKANAAAVGGQMETLLRQYANSGRV